MSEMHLDTQKKYGGRNEILGRSGKLAEKDVDVDGVVYVVRELTGVERAAVIGQMAEARLEKRVDVGSYQRSLLLHGVCDPQSPEGAREAAFSEADMDAVMRNGAGFLDQLSEPIEELSGLSEKAKEAAKAFLDATPSRPSTSDSLES